MWGITIFGLIVVLLVIAAIAAIGSYRMGRRETTMGDEESPLNRPKTGA